MTRTCRDDGIFYEAEADDDRVATEEEWAAFDGDVWNLSGPAEALMTLDELAEHEAAIYRSWGTAAGDLFAERMMELAGQIRAFDATTPDQFRDRRDAFLDSDGLGL